MKKMWQVWTAFAVCLVIGWTGMAWLTARAIELDRAEARSRRAAIEAREQTELQDRIATALWRMDAMLAPLIAQEITRPSFVYRPFVRPLANKGGKGAPTKVVSPLLMQPPRYVELNFEVSERKGWTSPQSPDETELPQAVAAGVPPDWLSWNGKKLKKLGSSVSFKDLLSLLPESLLPLGGPQEAEGRVSSANRANGYYAIPNTEAEGQQQGRRSPSRGLNASSRAQQEWQRRNEGMQNVARSQMEQRMSNSILVPESMMVEREGVSRPLWIGSKLILARRVTQGDDVRIQGCWLDWPKIKSRLQEEVADLFPEIDLLPVTDVQSVPPGRLLATLPVQIAVPTLAKEVPLFANSGRASLSAMRISLAIAWCCLLIGSVAVAILLRGILALSERRASFVSAVTHELRSPLTTFRMYAEMLAEGMVRDDQQRDRYLHTLRREADRLSHLVDNVLQYARLEQGHRKRHRSKVEMKVLMRQTTERLPHRVEQAGMELDEKFTPQAAMATVLTDAAAVEQIVFNLVDNSCKYASQAEDRRIHVHWSVDGRRASVRVTDHGPGIQPAQAKKLFLPFSKSDLEAAHTAPGIGLGLALCRRLAHEIGGKLHFESNDREGATFLLELPLA